MSLVHVSFAVANIKGNPVMPIADVVADLRKLEGLNATVTAAVEISNSAYKRAFTQTFASQRVCNISSEEPTATTLPVKATWVTKLVDGVARVSPSRYNAYTRLDLDIPILVIAKHPVSGANRRGAAARRTFGMAVRRRLFARDTRLTSRKITRANANGVTVVVLMDSNNIRETVYTQTQIVASHGGLMWITIHPAPKVKVMLGRERTIPVRYLHTDHAMLFRAVTFNR